jgi:hypothetical protein
MRREGQLPPDEHPRVATVARVAGVVRAADSFILDAEDMLDQRRFALVVLAAQIHVEMTVRDIVTTFCSRQSGPLARLVPEIPRSWSLMDKAGRDLFEALTGVRPTTAPCWEDYRAHVARRNSIAHRGTEATEAGAQESIDTAVAMVRFVEGLARTSP